MKTYEIIGKDGKSHFISAKSKKEVLNFWVSEKPKKVIIRKDVHPSFVI
jgi:hypothetical protein